MRWSYKTVHYELKKEGILGSSFLDESEVELSLNEYGKSGWELVSLLETMDGLIAVFKQPLSLDTDRFYPPDKDVDEELASVEDKQIFAEPLPTDGNSTYDNEVGVVEDFDVINDEEPKPAKAKKSSLADVDVGSIVIE